VKLDLVALCQSVIDLLKARSRVRRSRGDRRGRGPAHRRRRDDADHRDSESPDQLRAGDAGARHRPRHLTAFDGWHSIEIADGGPGIPPEIRAALFRPFKTTKARGTGLGMATAKRLNRMRCGQIAWSARLRRTTMTLAIAAPPRR
jgi:hypothetical protein